MDTALHRVSVRWLQPCGLQIASSWRCPGLSCSAFGLVNHTGAVWLRFFAHSVRQTSSSFSTQNMSAVYQCRVYIASGVTSATLLRHVKGKMICGSAPHTKAVPRDTYKAQTRSSLSLKRQCKLQEEWLSRHLACLPPTYTSTSFSRNRKGSCGVASFSRCAGTLSLLYSPPHSCPSSAALAALAAAMLPGGSSMSLIRYRTSYATAHGATPPGP